MKAYRLWLVEEGLRCDGFYEIESLNELFREIKKFEISRGYGRTARITIQECTIDHEFDICCAESDYDIKINLDPKEKGKETVTWDDIWK